MTEGSFVLSPWVVIAGMAVVTAFTRFSGYWLVGRVTLSARAQFVLGAVPVSVLTSLVAPMVLVTGMAETAAALATVFLAWRAPALVAIVGGVVVVVLLRQVL